MMRFRISNSCWIVVLMVALHLGRPSLSAAGSPEDLEFFREEIHPLLQANCFDCHGAEKRKGGLSLISRQSILSGGDSGPAVSLEEPAGSLLLDMISYRDSNREMPPSGKLDEEDIQRLARWVALGVPYDPELEQEDAAHEEEGAGFRTTIDEVTRNYWAFRPIRKPDPPSTSHEGWNEHPVDAFVAARLEEAGLAPNPPAPRGQWIRRAYYNLIGLPPTLEAVEAFESDASPDAYQKVVDYLLSRPQYGEKWGRHWLDLVRYAETNGYERDGRKPEAWRYRDYVIRSFNQDKPYDVFIQEQLAGDEMDQVTTDSIIATGYQRLGIWDDEPADPDQAYYDGLDDVLSTTSQVFLGLTVGCARCHDHKIDPIPQRDYYRMLGFFHNTLNNITPGRFKKSPYTLNTLRTIASPEEIADHEARSKAYSDKLAALGRADEGLRGENRSDLLQSGEGGRRQQAGPGAPAGAEAGGDPGRVRTGPVPEGQAGGRGTSPQQAATARSGPVDPGRTAARRPTPTC